MTHILVVDDNPLDRKLISALLQRKSNWSVEAVNDGQQAIDCLESQNVDLVVTDLQMPVMDGLSLVKQIRERFTSVPVVLVTAFGSERESVAALQAGAANFSHKSRLQTDLVPTVRNVLDWADSIQALNLHHDADGDSRVERKMAFVLDNNVGQIRNLIETLDANLPEWAQSESLRISMALDEALSNAICHGNLEIDSNLKDVENCSAFENAVNERLDCEPFCDRRVRVQAAFSDDLIRIDINDDGPGFNPGTLPDPTSPENIRKPSGRGLLLIRSFMDQVIHNQSGNAVTLIKQRK